MFNRREFLAAGAAIALSQRRRKRRRFNLTLQEELGMRSTTIVLGGGSKFRLGTGGIPSGTGTIGSKIDHQRTAYHSAGAYIYNGPTGPWVWTSGPNDMLDGEFIWYQTKATTRAAYDTMLDTFPATRTGKVYMHYHNEPEDNITSGTFTMADWQARTDALYAAIDAQRAVGRCAYVLKAIEIMDYTINLWAMGTGGQSTTGARNPNNYVRPGCEHIGLSQYTGASNPTIVNGHATAPTTGTTIVNRDVEWLNSVGFGNDWSGAAGGMPLPAGYELDTISQQNQEAWFREIVAAAKANGAHTWGWFDTNWSTGTYEFDSLPLAAQAQIDMAIANGQ